ncbi:hypothetical protein D3C81_1641590 [compost metagenome]
MQRNGCFSAARHALDNQRRVLGRTDNSVLLLLNRRDDIAEPVVLVLTQPVDEKFIRHHRCIAVPVIGIRNPLQNTLADNHVALEIYEPLNQPFRGIIRDRFCPSGKRIEQACYRCAPVDD